MALFLRPEKQAYAILELICRNDARLLSSPHEENESVAGLKAKPKQKKRSASNRTGSSVKKLAKKGTNGSRTRSKKAASALVTCKLDKNSAGDCCSSPDPQEKGQVVTTERRNLERRKPVNRRRQIDPTTCERDYTLDEIEFMNALDEYKRKNGRMFPTCSEVLEVIKELGYAKASSDHQPLATVDG